MKLFRKIISLVLTAALIYEGVLLTSIAVFAANKQDEKYQSEIITKVAEYNGAEELKDSGWYISDVMVAYGGTLEDAEQKIRDKGYLPYPQNTNEYGAGMPTCIGYKLTQNKDEAITSLKLMNQHGGYKEFDYEGFLESKIDGLEDTVKGMMTACKKMRENVRGGNEAAKIALQYLNLYHVPGDEADTESKRVLLGDYLLDEKRTYDEYKKILLVTDASTLSFINGHLGAGCNDSYVPKEQTILVGGIQNCEKWLKNAFDAMLNNQYLYCIEDDGINDYWLYLTDHCYSDAVLLLKNLERAKPSETTVEELTKIKNDANNGKAKKISGIKYDNLWDFLCNANRKDLVSERLLYAFVDALPEGLSTQYFIEIVNMFFEKKDGTLPLYYNKTPEVESAWMMKAMNELRTKGYDPDNAAWVEKQLKTCVNSRDKIERLVSMIDDFYIAYYNAEVAFGNVCGFYPDEITEEDAEMARKEAQELIEQGVDISQDTLADDLAVLSAYTQLAQYSIITESTTLNGYQLPPGYLSWEQVEMPKEGDPTNLGEYLFMISEYSGADEKKTLDAKIAMASVLYNAMTDAQHYNISSCGLIYFFNFAGYGGEGLAKYKEVFEVEGKKFSDAVLDEIGTPTMSIWYGTHEDWLHIDNLYQTSRSLRADATEEALKNAIKQKKKDEERSAYLSMCTEAIGTASIVAGFISTIVALSVEVSFKGMFTAMGAVAGNLVLSSGTASAITASMVGAAVAGVFFVVSIILLVAMIVILIISLIPPSEPPIEFTPIPETMLDLADDSSDLIRYDVARDQNGDPGDFNKNSQRLWLALYYSKDVTAGSPIMAESETDAGFVVQFGNMAAPEKYVPLSKFGENVVFNLNADQKEDTTGGIFLFYKTVNSENDIAEEGYSRGKYISDIKLGISTYKEAAKSAVTNESGYTLLDVNLTPNSKEYFGTQYYTYIGYSTTNSRSRALTDIRAAYATDAAQIYFGDGLYYNVFPSNQISCPLHTYAPSEKDQEQTPFYYQLYYSRSSAVGDPILADSLRVIKNFGDLKPNEEYARCFSGEAFDPQAEMDYVKSNPTDHSNPLMDPEHHFLAYSDEKPADYDGSKTYLAGFAFFSGRQTMKVLVYQGAGRYGKSVYWEEKSLLKREAALFGITLLGTNLTPVEKTDIGENMYLGYTTTNNPKKAIYSIGVFVGEEGPNKFRQYPANLTNNGLGFGASNVYVIPNGSQKVNLRYNHAFISTVEDELDYPHYWMGFQTFQRGRAMYQAGPTANSEYAPILLSDVIWTTSAYALPLSSGTNSDFTYLTGEKVNGALPTGYRSLHALVEKYHDVYDAAGQLLTPGTNLGFNHPERDSSIYIYYRSEGKRTERGTYVSKVEIVGETGDSATAGDGNSYIEQSLISGLTYGDEIIGLDDPLGVYEAYALHYDDSPIFDGNGGRLEWGEGSLFSNWGAFHYAASVVYLSVSYSNRAADALSTIVISTNPKGAELPSKKSAVIDDKGTKVDVSKGASTCPAGINREWWEYRGRNAAYTVYSSKNGLSPIGRIAIVRDNEADLNLNGRGFRYLKDENGNIFNPYDAEDPLKRQAVVLIEAYRAEYIESIVAFDDMNTTEAWNDLMKKGYQEMITTDALAGLGTGRVHLGIKRTSSSLNAVKDIICAPANYGESYTYNGRQYKRVNNSSLSYGVPLTAQDVFLYATSGNDDDNYGSRPIDLAIRNLGVLIENDHSRTVYWNGKAEKSVLSSSTNKAVIKTEDGKSQDVTILMTTNVGGSNGLLDGGALGRQEEYFKKYPSAQYEAFRNNSGNSRLVFTNLAGKNVVEYQKGYTGAMSIFGNNGIAVIILGSVFVLAVGGVILFMRKKRKAGSEKNK